MKELPCVRLNDGKKNFRPFTPPPEQQDIKIKDNDGSKSTDKSPKKGKKEDKEKSPEKK